MARLFAGLTDDEVDKAPVPQTTLADLDMRKVMDHMSRALPAGRCQGALEQPEAFLERYRCVALQNGALTPTVAGILIFGNDPQLVFPHGVVGLAHFPGVVPGTDDVLHLERYGGTLPEQIDAVDRYLWSNTRRGFTTDDSPQRVERPEYPRRAIRELTVNAIAHRDYNEDARYSRVSMFMDRVEWISPGGLPGGITVANILQAQHSRNPSIAELLYQAGYIERFGLGLDMVTRELSNAGLPELSMRDSEGSFTVTMYGNDAPAIRAQTPFRLQLLAVARQQGQLTMTDARRINAEQGGYRSERSLHYDLRSLVDAGFLQRVGQSRDTTYIPASFSLKSDTEA
jgi:ATP-dependent DNA helicase RecG